MKKEEECMRWYLSLRLGCTQSKALWQIQGAARAVGWVRR